MFYQQSPIAMNMGGNMNQGFIPPNPISNVAIGSNGYNGIGNMGSYYTGTYNNYYNPYMAMKQQEAMKAVYMEEQRQQVDIMKTISKNVNKSYGTEVDDIFLKRYDPVDIIQQNRDPEIDINIRLANARAEAQYGRNPEVEGYIYAINTMYDKSKEMYPDSMGIYEFNKISSEINLQYLEEEYREKQRNVGTLYNRSQYNQLISEHSKANNSFSNVFGNTKNINSIDDLEVTLPSHLSNELAARREMFMKSIMGK